QPATRRGHIGQVLPLAGGRIEALERPEVLVGGPQPPTDRIDGPPVGGRREVVARGRNGGRVDPGGAVEDLGGGHELAVGLAAHDNDLVPDHGGGAGGAGPVQVGQLDPIGAVEGEHAIRREGGEV